MSEGGGGGVGGGLPLRLTFTCEERGGRREDAVWAPPDLRESASGEASCLRRGHSTTAGDR